MVARVRNVGIAAPGALGLALLLGLLAVRSPVLALAAAAGLPFALLVFSDLAAGFAALAFLGFVDILPSAGALSPVRAAGLLLVMAWMAGIVWRDRNRSTAFFSEHPLLTAALIAFLCWGALSTLWAESSGAGNSALSRYLQNMLLLPIAYAAVRTRRDVKLVAAAIVTGATVAALFAISAPTNPELVAEGGRATGTIGDPNELAASLLVGLAIGAGFAIGRGNAPLLRLLGLCAVPLCALGVLLSLSRGGLIAFGAMLIAAVLFGGRWRAPIAAGFGVVAVGGLVYFTQLASLPARERVTTSGDGSGRIDLWTIAARMVEDHPVLGVGVGNFQIASPHFLLRPGTTQRADLILSSAPKVAHNTYLGIAAELGIPGLLLFLTIVLISLVCGLRAARIWAALGDGTMEALARGVFLGLFGMLIADIFISEMYSKVLWTLLALGPALLAVARREAAEAELEPPGLRRRRRARARGG